MNFLKSLKSKHSPSNSLGGAEITPQENQDDRQRIDRKSENLKRLTAGLARSVLSSTFEEEHKLQEERTRQMEELEKNQKNSRYLYGCKRYGSGFGVKSFAVSIEPLNLEQLTKANDKRMISDLFSQVENVTKQQVLKSLSSQIVNTQDNTNHEKNSSNTPFGQQQQHQKQQQNNQQPDENYYPTQNNTDRLDQKSATARDFYPKTVTFPKNEPISISHKHLFQLTSPHSMYDRPNGKYNTFHASSQNHRATQSNIHTKNSNPQNNNQISTNPYFTQMGNMNSQGSQQGGTVYGNNSKNTTTIGNSNKLNSNSIKNLIKDEYSFQDDFSIEMPVYSRYRTFFFKPLDRENMFEGMKYIQYEQYVRKDSVMQGVMTLDLTKILSDKCYSLKSSFADKPKIMRIFSSLRPQQKIDLNKRLEETIALQESIALLVLQDFRDNLSEVGIDPSPLEPFKSNRMQHLNIFFKSMSREYYIEHIFNQIYEEAFQQKFSEQILQEQYEILFNIKKQLKSLCYKIGSKIEYFEQQQQEDEELKLDDETDIRDQLKIIDTIIHNTKSIQSTATAIAKQKEKGNTNNNSSNANNNNLSKKSTGLYNPSKLLDDEESFEMNKQLPVIYEVFNTASVNTAYEQSNNDSQLKRQQTNNAGLFGANSNSLHINLNQVNNNANTVTNINSAQQNNNNYNNPNQNRFNYNNSNGNSNMNANTNGSNNNNQYNSNNNTPLNYLSQGNGSSQGKIPQQGNPTVQFAPIPGINLDNQNSVAGSQQSIQTTPQQQPPKRRIIKREDTSNLVASGQNTPSADQQQQQQSFPPSQRVINKQQNPTPVAANQPQQQQQQFQQSSFQNQQQQQINSQQFQQNNNNNSNQQQQQQWNNNNNNNNNNTAPQQAALKPSLQTRRTHAWEEKKEGEHVSYMKMIIRDIGDEYEVFNDNIYLYEKIADFLRDCIDSYRVMVRQKEFQKFDDNAVKKFLRYSTKVRFNISELSEQFRNFEKSVESRTYWKQVMSGSQGMSIMNFQSAQKQQLFKAKQSSGIHSSSLQPHLMTSQSSDVISTESKRQRIGRLQNALADKFNFSKRQAQTRESKVELNNYKFEEEKKLLMDSHLSPDQVVNIVADNRRKLALQRLRNPFEEPFAKKTKKKPLTQNNPQPNEADTKQKSKAAATATTATAIGSPNHVNSNIKRQQHPAKQQQQLQPLKAI